MTTLLISPTVIPWLITRLVPVEEADRMRPDDRFPGIAVRPSSALSLTVQRAALVVSGLPAPSASQPLLIIPLSLDEAYILIAGTENSPSTAQEAIEMLEEDWGWAAIVPDFVPSLTPLLLVSATTVRLAAGTPTGLPYFVSPALPLTAWPTKPPHE